LYIEWQRQGRPKFVRKVNRVKTMGVKNEGNNHKTREGRGGGVRTHTRTHTPYKLTRPHNSEGDTHLEHTTRRYHTSSNQVGDTFNNPGGGDRPTGGALDIYPLASRRLSGLGFSARGGSACFGRCSIAFVVGRLRISCGGGVGSARGRSRGRSSYRGG
jgi:hypothetical protein